MMCRQRSGQVALAVVHVLLGREWASTKTVNLIMASTPEPKRQHLQNLLEFIPLMKHICPKYIWIQLTVFAIVRRPAILWAWLKGRNEICASMYEFTFACLAGPTYCKMQGTGINFLHFAETFGLWMTLACKKQSENRIHCTRTHHSVAISAAVLKSPPWCLRHLRHALHIGYAARPSLRKRISYSDSVMTD